MNRITCMVKTEGEYFGFVLNQEQKKYINRLKTKKERRVGDFFEKYILPPKKGYMTLLEKKNIGYEIEEDEVHKPLTIQFKTEEETVEATENMVKITENTYKVIVIYDGTLTIDGVIKGSFLTASQEAFLKRKLNMQKKRVKKLFMDLWRESDIYGDRTNKYYIEYNYGLGKVSFNNHPTRFYFTPYFSSENKVKEMISKYKAELDWYYTKYQGNIEMEIELEN